MNGTGCTFSQLLLTVAMESKEQSPGQAWTNVQSQNRDNLCQKQKIKEEAPDLLCFLLCLKHINDNETTLFCNSDGTAQTITI